MTSSTTEDIITAFRQIFRGFSDFPRPLSSLIVGQTTTNSDKGLRTRVAWSRRQSGPGLSRSHTRRLSSSQSNQVMAFLDALESKSAEFLARTAKTVWILDETVLDDAIDRFHYMFSKCLSLEVLVSFDDYFCSKLLRLIPKPQNGSHALQELTIIQPGHRVARNLDLTHLFIQRLQIIDGHISFATSLYDRASTDNMHHTSIIKSNLVPLLT